MVKKTETKKTAKKEVKKDAVEKKPKKIVADKAVKTVKAVKVADDVKKTPAVKKKPTEKNKYFEAVGRRKTSVARVRLFAKGDPEFIVNDKKMEDYFPTKELQNTVSEPLRKMKLVDKFRITVKLSGGGISSQAGALRHAIARSLTKFNPDFRKRLKKASLLTRDPRMKERRKFGLKKARKASQWSKR
jgi:small subunit ribosomal protein S9